ncbi:MAG: hypothetical protein AMXMBFR84_38780 [Candidatus Hydrogenedentota bacterium]
MTNLLVSILMPVWNSESSLETAIKSILDQTYAHWELIAVDDGSTDDTNALLHAASKRDSRIRVIHQPHEGIVAALRHAHSVAQGQFLARMDADDWTHPDRIAQQLNYMTFYPDIALCGTQVESLPGTIGSGRERYQQWINTLTTPESVAREMFVECPVAHPTFFLRREPFEAVGGYEDIGWAEDYDVVLRLHAAGYALSNVAKPLLRWTNHSNRHSMNHPRYAPAAFRAAKRHYLQQCHLSAGDPFIQWGAGVVGKEWLKEWPQRPLTVVDINPRKIGRVIHGAPVIAPDELPPPGGPFVVVAVGAPGARDEIRSWLSLRGYMERRHYVFVA